METNVKNKVSPTQGEIKEDVSPANIKLSEQVISFHNGKTRYISSLPELFPMERGVCGCQNPIQAPFQETRLDRVRESTRRYRESLMYSVPSVVREQAVDTLNLLIRFDKSVSIEESRVLMDAVKIITAKGLIS